MKLTLCLITILFTLNIHAIECVHFDGFRCIYSPKEINSNAQLLVYFRGHWNYRGDVPKSKRRDSINEVFKRYDLKVISNKLEMPLLVTSSSHLGVNKKIIIDALKLLNLPLNTEIIFASHSGGYKGYLRSLKNLQSSELIISDLLMLDNFYFHKSNSALIKSYIQKGSNCSGYYTRHNQSRLDSRFTNQVSKSQCNIELRVNHNLSVNNCLTKYLTQQSCL
jgi:prenyltransferase beta subunit